MTSATLSRKLLVAALALALVGSAFAIGGAVAGQTDDGPATDDGLATDDEPETEDDEPDAGDESDADDEPDAEDEPDTQQTSYLRVAHASPDAPAVDVAVDNESVLTDVAFGDVSDYLALEAGTHNVTITDADDADTVVFDDQVTLDARTATTFAAAGEIGENASAPFEPVLYHDDALAPGENESAISLIHLSTDAPAVDVTTENGSEVLAENVSYGDASDYATLPAGDYDLEIREAAEDDEGAVVTTANVSLDEGTAYSALALGYLESGNESDAGDNETDVAGDESDAVGNESNVTGSESGATGDEAADDASVDGAFEIVPTEDATWSVALPTDDTPTDANETAADETPTEIEATEDGTPTGTETPAETDEDETPTETEDEETATEPGTDEDEPMTSTPE